MLTLQRVDVNILNSCVLFILALAPIVVVFKKLRTIYYLQKVNILCSASSVLNLNG